MYNLHEKQRIELLEKNLNSLSGIYAFKYNDSSKKYVGSSINLSVRTIEHINYRNFHVYLQNAFKKKGLNNLAEKSRAGSKHTEATKKLMSKIKRENPYFFFTKRTVLYALKNIVFV